jgi:UDP-3-O-[3-hydroxymyristoyl] N-acetylglucosamine deacetylase
MVPSKEGDIVTATWVSKPRHTIQRSVQLAGKGLFTGQAVVLALHPAPSGTGVVFRRTDLPGSPHIPADADLVVSTPRCTVLGQGEIVVQTVEHLLSAVRACDIDDLCIDVSGAEVPIADGSALPFMQLLHEAGRHQQEGEAGLLVLNEPVFWSYGGAQIIALPSEEFRFSYTLHYPHCAAIGSQFYTFVLTPEAFRREIAPARTFSIYEEIAPMIEKGLVKGGGLDCAVLVKEGRVANPEGLRFPDEMVRHKIVDLIGDLSLAPQLRAHVVAICSGHTSNNAFAKHLLNLIKVENCDGRHG